MAEFEEEVTRDIARQARVEDLEDRTKITSMSETISGRSAGVVQADILSRTFAEDAPMRMRQVTGRESTNVEDRRFVDDPIDPDAPLAIGQRVVGDEPFDRAAYETHRLFGTPEKGPSLRSSTFRGSDAWSQITQMAGDAAENLRVTMDLWLNPEKFPVREGTSMAEREVIDRNKESRRFTGIVDAASLAQTGAMGVGRALAPLGEVLTVGASKGKVYNSGVGSSAVKIEGDVFTGMNHSDALERAAARTGRPYDELAEIVGKAKDGEGWYIDGAYKTRQEVEGLAASRVPPTPPKRSVALSTARGDAYKVEQQSDPRQWLMKGEDGETLGEFAFTRDPSGKGMNITGLSTEDYGTPRGSGLSAPVYKHFKELADTIGEPLVPSDVLTEASYRNWLKMDKNLIARGNYVQEQTDEGMRWVRKDPTFQSPVRGVNVVEIAPDQSVMNFKFPEGTSPQAVYRREITNRVRAGDDVTMTPPPGSGVDISYAPHMNADLVKKSAVLVRKKADDVVTTLKKEMPDLSYDVDKSGRSSYISIKEGDKVLLQARVGDHGATHLDSLSIDPVSGNTVETVLEALRYERGLTDKAPEVGWSYAPPTPIRKAMRQGTELDVFPDHRQIGGRGVYQKSGYANNRRPYEVTSHTIGTDIQVSLGTLREAAE